MAKRTRKSGRKSKPDKTPARRKPPKLDGVTKGGEGIEVIARGCLVHGSCVLLCRNLKHGYLYLPGGHVEFGESARRALAREFVEECGLAVRVGDLALVSEGAFATKRRDHHEINLVFHVELSGGGKGASGTSSKPPKVKSKEDWIGFDWVELAAVVDVDIRPTSAKAWLATTAGHSGSPAEWVSEIESASRGLNA